MPTVVQKPTIINWAKAVSIRPLSVDGNLPDPVPDVTWVHDLYDIPIQFIIEQGETVVDKADGIGVIAVHEEDDTLIGADIDLNSDSIDFYLLSLIVGGTLTTDDSGNITSWTPPSITQQRDNPKRFELDLYVESDNGYLRHRFFYCRGQQKSINYRLGLAGPSLTIKARQNPSTELVHYMEYVSQIPNI